MRILSSKYLYANIIAITLIFLVSVIVRWPNLNAPIGRHHEFITGHVLISMYMMEKDGMAHHHFSSAFCHDAPGDKLLNAHAPVHSKDSVSYYVSYPPGCFVLPYIFIKATGADISIPAIRAYSTINHFATAIVIFLLIYLIFDKNIKDLFFAPAYLGYIIFLFASGNLWFLSNVYFCDMQVNIFVLLTIYFSIRILKSERITIFDAISLASFSFLGIYTEWLAVFSTFLLGCTFIIASLYKKRNWKIVGILVAASLFSIGITYFQYATIAGQDALFKYWEMKLQERASTGDIDNEYQRSNIYSKQIIYDHFIYNYQYTFEFYCGSAFLLISIFISNLFLKVKSINLNWKPLLSFGVITFACLLHALIFYNFTAEHDFSNVKFSMVMAIVCAMALAEFIHLISKMNFGKWFLWASGVIYIVWYSIFFISDINLYYSNHPVSEAPHTALVLGEAVKKYSTGKEMIISQYSSPESRFIGQRNILHGKSIADAKQELEWNSGKEALLISITPGKKAVLDSVTRVFVNGYSTNIYRRE